MLLVCFLPESSPLLCLPLQSSLEMVDYAAVHGPLVSERPSIWLNLLITNDICRHHPTLMEVFLRSQKIGQRGQVLGLQRSRSS